MKTHASTAPAEKSGNRRLRLIGNIGTVPGTFGMVGVTQNAAPALSGESTDDGCLDGADHDQLPATGRAMVVFIG